MIKMVTPMDEIERMIEEEIRKSERDIIKKLSYIGESVIGEARKNGAYEDQTGNLRSSVGYVILNNGKTVLENIQKSDRGTDRSTGVQVAKDFIQEISERYKKDFVLIVVAGMDYAVYVEAMGLNVLSSSKLLAEAMTKRLL